jgi:hypothetical protein
MAKLRIVAILDAMPLLPVKNEPNVISISRDIVARFFGVAAMNAKATGPIANHPVILFALCQIQASFACRQHIGCVLLGAALIADFTALGIDSVSCRYLRVVSLCYSANLTLKKTVVFHGLTPCYSALKGLRVTQNES